MKVKITKLTSWKDVLEYARFTQGKLNKVLVVATGALMSTQSSLQGDSIPRIAHAISIENEVV